MSRPRPTAQRLRQSLAWLERRGTKRNREGMARYGIIAPRAYGVSAVPIRQLGKRLGTDPELAARLWDSGWFEARILSAFVDDPARLTAAAMDRRARDFDNWAICDALCFRLFDRSPHAWRKVEQWSRRPEEFVRRAAFALLASLALHDTVTDDGPFLRGLGLAQDAASDARHLVKKAVSWALRSVGRRNPRLHQAALEASQRLASSPDVHARWVGRDAVRGLTSPAALRRVALRTKMRTRARSRRGSNRARPSED